MPPCEHHEWLKKRDWPAVYNDIAHPDRDIDLLRRKYKERDEHGRLPHHWMAAKAQTHTHALAFVGVQSIGFNEEALITRDKEGKTPMTLPVGVEPVLRSSACSPSLPRKLFRWVGRGCSACTHQWLIGWRRCMGGSNHDRLQTVTSGSMSTMTSWCVKCSNTTILLFFEPLLAIARFTAIPSCFLLFE